MDEQGSTDDSVKYVKVQTRVSTDLEQRAKEVYERPQ